MTATTDIDTIHTTIVPTSVTDAWDVLVKAWTLAYAESPNTVKAYSTDAKMFRAWCEQSGIDALHAVRVHCDAYKAHLLSRGGYAGRPAAPKTVARKLSALASLYKYLVDEGFRDHSPLSHVKRPKAHRDYAATISLDERQLRAVLEAARDHSPTAGALCSFLALTGVRASEALGADVTDVVADHGYRCLNIVRKGGHDDRVTIPPDAATVLERYMAGRDGGPLFVDANGTRVGYAALLWMLERIRRSAGLSEVTRLHPHMLRASYATIAFDQGVPGDRIQDGLGHSDPRTTRMYDRGRGKLKRKAEPGLVVAKHVMWDVEA